MFLASIAGRSSPEASPLKQLGLSASGALLARMRVLKDLHFRETGGTIH